MLKLTDKLFMSVGKTLKIWNWIDEEYSSKPYLTISSVET